MLKTLKKHIKLIVPVFIAAALFFGSQYSIDLLSDFRLPSRLQDLVSLSLSIFVEAFPFLVLGSLLAVLVRVFIPASLFYKILPKQGASRRFAISLMGFLFPVCECGNVPLARTLLMQKLSVADSVTFLLAAPVLNPITIWATHEAFGFDTKIVLTRVVATLIIANLVGLLISLRKDQDSYLTDNFKKSRSEHDHSHESTLSLKEKFKILPSGFQAEAITMLKMLAFGALIAGVIQTLVPRGALVAIGSDVILSIVVMLLLAFVISICANVDAFFALSFSGSFTAGSIVSFLVFGPMIDIKMLALMKTTFKTELLIMISLVVLAMSALTGLVFTYAL